MSKVHKILSDAAETFKERDETYGSGYTRYGKILKAYFPNGIKLETEDDFRLFANFVMCICKTNRFAHNLTSGGHADSAHDLVVYAAMLEEKCLEIGEENDS